MYLIFFYVPETHLAAVKNALFAAGAGQAGDYQHCAWQTAGQGQFCPLPGSQPFIGKTHQLSEVIEYKVEMVCAADYLAQAVATLKKNHPYEEPGYGVLKMEDF
jgi:structural toxin protein (hemagglutinin/hemolysin) RtxA